MKRIENSPPFDLRPGAEPEAIAILEDALLCLTVEQRIRLADDARREFEEDLRNDRASQTDGSGTSDMVILVREQIWLEAGEVVGEPTAAVLNQLLEERLEWDALCPRFVAGRITDMEEQPVHGRIVLLGQINGNIIVRMRKQLLSCGPGVGRTEGTNNTCQPTAANSEAGSGESHHEPHRL